MEFFELISENLTGLGGPMGTERTSTNYTKKFKDDLESGSMKPVIGSAVRKAKAFAEKEYGKKIEWIKTEKGYRSPDLGYVMYHINEITFEE